MNRFFFIALLALLSTACVKDSIGDIAPEQAPSDKIHNWGGEPGCVSEAAAKGRLMVRLNDKQATIAVEGIELEVEPLFPKAASDTKLERWQLVHFDKELDLKSVAESIAALEDVERVEFDLKMKRIVSESLPMPSSRPEPTRSVELPFDDPELPYQWHYYNDGSLADYADKAEQCLAGADINLLNAWKYTAGDSRVIVAVMDGGIMCDHPDLKDNMWVNEAEQNGQKGVDDDGNGYVDDIHGYNFVADSGNVTADDHGTHVAGTIGAVNNNGYAVCGIAGGTGNNDGVRLMSIQIFDGEESCYQHQIVRGYQYAADNGAVLINNSWGYDPESYISDNEFEKWDSALKNAIDYFEANARLEGVMEGGMAIFAAGNETYHQPCYPGAYHKYVCVTAMSSDYTAAYYTNYGPGCNVVAPGGDANYGTLFCISSTSIDTTYGYEYMQGTSMATPHVTGCAALALSYALKQGYTLTPDYLRALIQTSVHDINQYQTGTKRYFDYVQGSYYNIDLAPYAKKLGSGYIDAHLLLMQLDSTPCLYFKTGVATSLSLDEYFGGGSEDLTYQGCEISDEVRDALGMQNKPRIENGLLSIKCNKPGVGRIKVNAIIGGQTVGGGDVMGGMVVEREFELVVRGSVADNGGWL
ncbi:MAG: S8 family serine peptidase [Alistipes sp.]|nr:S8 family serine peptidase [Alistipes sp.]